MIAGARSSRRGNPENAHLSVWSCSTSRAARMAETIEHTFAPEAGTLADAAAKATAWAGEPFLHDGEDPAEILAPGTARRRALDDAVEEIDAGLKAPSPQWKVRYSLMLGLERVLSEKPPHL